MPDLKETIARLRELRRIIFSPHHTVSVRAIQEFRELVIENAGPLLDAAEECEKLRAALKSAESCVTENMRCNHPPPDGGDDCDGEDCIKCFITNSARADQSTPKAK